MHTADTHGECSSLVAYRAFEEEFVTEHSDGECAVQLLVIAVYSPDIYDTGDPASITGRIRSLVECDFLDRLGSEYREEAQHVVDIVQRSAVQHDEVLVRSTSPDMQG